MKKRTAYTLIEISAAVIIAGFLIAGVLNGSRVLNYARKQSAQKLTYASSTIATKGLVLWLESSFLESFEPNSKFDDGALVNNWYDRSLNKYVATTTPSSAITYKEFSDINKLPAVYFDGTSAATLTLQDGAGQATAIFTPNNAFSFFIVSKLVEDANNLKTVFANGNNSGWGFALGGSQGSRLRRITLMGGTDDDATVATTSIMPEVISATYAGGSSGATKLFVNGTTVALTSTTITAPSPDNVLYIGNKLTGSPWRGYIAEIIIFNRALSDFDRKQIESYLGQKYGIKIQP